MFITRENMYSVLFKHLFISNAYGSTWKRMCVDLCCCLRYVVNCAKCGCDI